MKIISNNKPGRKTTEGSRAVLDKTGARVTSQRALILDIIRRGEGHLDADEIHRRARQKQPRLSLSTVYRTMQALKRLGLVEELHLNESHHHYEVKPATEHHHLVCLGCGRVIEFRYPLSQNVKRSVAEARNFKIAGAEVRISGYCPECQKKGA